MLTTTAHTPSPWTAEKIEKRGARQERYDITGISDDERVTLARVHHGGQEWEEFEANARLIAAAPELLALIRFAANELTPDNGVTKLTTEARALIARIEG